MANFADYNYNTISLYKKKPAKKYGDNKSYNITPLSVHTQSIKHLLTK